MIIYGWRASKRKTEEAPGQICENCQSENSTFLVVLSRYVHIFWIPFFPIGKTVKSVCHNCKAELKAKKMNPELKEYAIQLKNETSIPKWQFLGLGLLGIFILLTVYFGMRSDAEKAAFFSDPQINDVYEYKVFDGYYSTMRIFDMVGDSIMFEDNEYGIDKKYSLSQIEHDTSYQGMFSTYHKDELKEMFDNEDIFDIKR